MKKETSSKVAWLNLGDSNNKFFSVATKIRKSKNSTIKILNKEGHQKIKRTILEQNSMNYFRNLYGERNQKSPIPVIFPRIVVDF